MVWHCVHLYTRTFVLQVVTQIYEMLLHDLFFLLHVVKLEDHCFHLLVFDADKLVLPHENELEISHYLMIHLAFVVSLLVNQ